MRTDNIIKPLTLEVDKDLWERLKNRVPRTKTLNAMISELVSEWLRQYEIQEMVQNEMRSMTKEEMSSFIKKFDFGKKLNTSETQGRGNVKK